jgi:dipeptidase E
LYGAATTWEGLGVIDYAFVPHTDSPGHPETRLVAAVAREYRAHAVNHRTLRDGQAIVVEGDRHELV